MSRERVFLAVLVAFMSGAVLTGLALRPGGAPEMPVPAPQPTALEREGTEVSAFFPPHQTGYEAGAPHRSDESLSGNAGSAPATLAASGDREESGGDADPDVPDVVDLEPTRSPESSPVAAICSRLRLPEGSPEQGALAEIVVAQLASTRDVVGELQARQAPSAGYVTTYNAGVEERVQHLEKLLGRAGTEEVLRRVPFFQVEPDGTLTRVAFDGSRLVPRLPEREKPADCD